MPGLKCLRQRRAGVAAHKGGAVKTDHQSHGHKTEKRSDESGGGRHGEPNIHRRGERRSNVNIQQGEERVGVQGGDGFEGQGGVEGFRLLLLECGAFMLSGSTPR